MEAEQQQTVQQKLAEGFEHDDAKNIIKDIFCKIGKKFLTERLPLRQRTGSCPQILLPDTDTVRAQRLLFFAASLGHVSNDDIKGLNKQFAKHFTLASYSFNPYVPTETELKMLSGLVWVRLPIKIIVGYPPYKRNTPAKEKSADLSCPGLQLDLICPNPTTKEAILLHALEVNSNQWTTRPAEKLMMDLDNGLLQKAN